MPDLDSLAELRWPVAFALVGGVVLLLLGWWSRRGRLPRPEQRLLVAHAARVRALPRYRALLRRRRLLGAVQALAALVVVAGATVVLARPQAVETRSVADRSRDIMLCLDASASMDDDNVKVVRAVQDLVAGLEGDRVGLTLWSGAAVTVFPLTDDYDYVTQQLDLAERAFSGKQESYFAGVQLADPRASLIGDGIVSCAQRFDLPERERSRALVVSSDNDPFGESVYSLDEAAAYAQRRDVLLYAIGAPVLGEDDQAAARQGLAAAATSTGGTFALVGDDGATSDIVERIDTLERQRVDVAPRQVLRDDPLPGAALAALGLALLVVTWAAAGVLVVTDLLVRRRRRTA